MVTVARSMRSWLWLAFGVLVATGCTKLIGGDGDFKEVEYFQGVNDKCPAGQYCDSSDHCVFGCKSHDDCSASGNLCHPLLHRCTECTEQKNCAEGLYCGPGNTCEALCDDSAGLSCESGKSCCDKLCADVQSNTAHCGACGEKCSEGQSCCGGGCHSLDVDPDHCGSCGHACAKENGTATCTQGECGINCSQGWGDCSDAPGCETDLNQITNCGTCGKNCNTGVVHIMSASCEHEQCNYKCEAGWADCDPNVPGCETDLSKAENCGACGHVCNTVGSDMKCTWKPGDPAKGSCVFTQCQTGFADCDGTTVEENNNGCEANLSSTDHCGECYAKCGSAHGTPKCEASQCIYASCDSGWKDCKGTSTTNPHNVDGCETDLSLPQSCGDCGISCQTEHGTALCDQGTCSYQCQSGWADCSMTAPNILGCETPTTTVSNCGSCGNQCSLAGASAAVCEANGMCSYTCSPGFGDCLASEPGCETVLNSDPLNCGGCGIVCNGTHANGTPTCVNGKCQYATGCAAGFADCDKSGANANGCETDITTTENCGACGTNCPASSTVNGSFAPTCVAGQCSYSCQTNYADCDKAVSGANLNGCETDIASVTNCGSCGEACDSEHSNPDGCNTQFGYKCNYGSCKPGYKNCDVSGKDVNGCETSLSSTSNCGDCGVQCNSGTTVSNATCNGTSCQYTCGTNRVDCNTATAPNTDGCECKGNGCCGTGCQYSHANGLQPNQIGPKGNIEYYDCTPPPSWGGVEARTSCLSAFPTDDYGAGVVTPCPQNESSSSITELPHPTSGVVRMRCTLAPPFGQPGGLPCVCWSYVNPSGVDPYLSHRVHVSTAADNHCQIPTLSDPLWE
jgi:hypothetical protein